jgi:hypothetical protein
MKSSIILSSFDEWESVIKKTHDEGKTFGLLSENNRLFRYHISYEDRVKQLNKNVDVTALVFLLDYQTWVDMDPNFVSSIYGKRYFDGIDTVIKERNGTVDYLFIPKEPVMQYVKEAKEIVYSIAPLCPYIEYIDAVQYIKGCYSSIGYVSVSYKEKVDYNVLCPWQLGYNLVCHHVLNSYGIKSEFPGFTHEDIINKVEPIPFNPYNYAID